MGVTQATFTPVVRSIRHPGHPDTRQLPRLRSEFTSAGPNGRSGGSRSGCEGVTPRTANHPVVRRAACAPGAGAPLAHVHLTPRAPPSGRERGRRSSPERVSPAPRAPGVPPAARPRPTHGGLPAAAPITPSRTPNHGRAPARRTAAGRRCGTGPRPAGDRTANARPPPRAPDDPGRKPTGRARTPPTRRRTGPPPGRHRTGPPPDLGGSADAERRVGGAAIPRSVAEPPQQQPVGDGRRVDQRVERQRAQRRVVRPGESGTDRRPLHRLHLQHQPQLTVARRYGG